MDIQISFKNVDSSEAIKEYVNEKFGKLDKYFNNIQTCSVVLDVKNPHTHETRADLHLSGTSLQAHATTEDLYASIDETFEKLKHQITKYKEKIQDK